MNTEELLKALESRVKELEEFKTGALKATLLDGRIEKLEDWTREAEKVTAVKASKWSVGMFAAGIIAAIVGIWFGVSSWKDIQPAVVKEIEPKITEAIVKSLPEKIQYEVHKSTVGLITARAEQSLGSIQLAEENIKKILERLSKEELNARSAATVTFQSLQDFIKMGSVHTSYNPADKNNHAIINTPEGTKTSDWDLLVVPYGIGSLNGYPEDRPVTQDEFNTLFHLILQRVDVGLVSDTAWDVKVRMMAIDHTGMGGRRYELDADVRYIIVRKLGKMGKGQ